MTYRQNINAILATFAATVALLLAPITALPASASCEEQQELTERKGRYDRDQDGLSNCLEKKELGTDPKNKDSDDDGLDDGDELELGCDPLDPDSDDDGLEDGEEVELGSDPTNPDSDDDGYVDGYDLDPTDELDASLSGPVESIQCPVASTDGFLRVLCIEVVLTSATRFKGADSCEELAWRVAHNGGEHVEIKLESDGCELLARKVRSEDTDNDGSPDHVDEDDDGDGVPDEDDADDDDDGILDEDEDCDDDGYDDNVTTTTVPVTTTTVPVTTTTVPVTTTTVPAVPPAPPVGPSPGGGGQVPGGQVPGGPFPGGFPPIG